MKLRLHVYVLSGEFDEHDMPVTVARPIGQTEHVLPPETLLALDHPDRTRRLTTYIIASVAESLSDMREALTEDYRTDTNIDQYLTALSVIKTLVSLNLVTDQQLKSLRCFCFAKRAEDCDFDYGRRPKELDNTISSAKVLELFSNPGADTRQALVAFSSYDWSEFPRKVSHFLNSAAIKAAMDAYHQDAAVYKLFLLADIRAPKRAIAPQPPKRLVAPQLRHKTSPIFKNAVGFTRSQDFQALKAGITELERLEAQAEEDRLSSLSDCTSSIKRRLTNWFDEDDRSYIDDMDAYLDQTKERMTKILVPYKLTPVAYIKLMLELRDQFGNLDRFPTLRNALNSLEQTLTSGGESGIEKALKQIEGAFKHCSMSQHMWFNRPLKRDFQLIHHLFQALVAKRRQALTATPAGSPLSAVSALGGGGGAGEPRRHDCGGGGGGGGEKPGP
jgi:hypothetical protein